MNKKIVILLIFFVSLMPVRSYASAPVFDAVNAALSELRNAIMQSQFAQDIAISMERLEQLKATYFELTRFHAGFDDFFEVVIGDPVRRIIDRGGEKARDVFSDLGWFAPQIEILDNANGPEDIRYVVEKITGALPEDTQARPYIPFDEMQVVDGLQLAQEIRNSGTSTRNAADQMAGEAQTASPKGAARLGVAAQAQMIHLSQQNQEALAKLIELSATQVEQVSRDEKRYERERQSYMDDFRRGLENLREAL